MTSSPAGILDAKRTLSPFDASIALGLVACLIVAGYLCVGALYATIYYSDNIRWPEPEIVYVAADATTKELVCKVYNAGDRGATIEAIYINATPVSPHATLPVTIRGGAYATVVLPHDGPWNGSIQITLDSGYWYGNYSREVDLDVASTNPVGGAYPTPFELLPDYLHQHALEIAFAFVVILLVAVVAIVILLRRRGHVSMLVFLDEVLAFWIYFVVLQIFASSPASPFGLTLFVTLLSSVLSVATIYELLTYRSKRRLPVSRVSEQRATVE